MTAKEISLFIPGPSPKLAMSILVALSIPFIFLGIDQYGVVGTDEAFYQDIALGMLDRGNFLELRSGGAIYVYDTFANAPLQYWARSAIAAVLGKSMLSMRILSALSALLTVLATYRLVLTIGGRSAAFASGLVLLTSFQFLYLHSARTGELEPSVCLLLVCCALLFIRIIRNTGESPGRWWVHHLLVAILFNLKAPTAFLPLAAEVLAFCLIPGARSHFLPWLKSGLIALPFALAWHGYQALQYPEQVRSVLLAVGHQATGDFAAGPGGGLAGRALYYGQKLLFGSFPYVLLFPLAIYGAARAAAEKATRPDGQGDALRVLLAYLFTIVIFYLGISKVGPWYIVHAYPFLAALLGLYLSGLRSSQKQKAPIELLGIALALSLLFWLVPEIAGYNPFATDAYVIPMATHWRAVPGLSTGLGVALLAALVLGALAAGKRAMSAQFPGGLALLLFLLFVGYGATRSLAPLAYIDHLSPAAALDADLGARVAAGSPIPFPVDVPSTHPWVVNYYFYRDFDLRISDGEDRPAFRKPTRYTLLGWRPGRSPKSSTPIFGSQADGERAR